MRLISTAFNALLRLASHRRLALLVYVILIGVAIGEIAVLQGRWLSPSRRAAMLAPTFAPATPMSARATVGTTATASVGVTATARATPGPATITVRIVEPPGQDTDFWAYSPATLQVHVGTTVVWINTGRAPHTATADDGTRFDSATLYPQATFRFTPRQAGTIAYHCTLHPWMKGTLVVQP